MDRSERTRETLRSIARGTVVAAVVVSPWLFGSADPWAYLFICVVIGVGTAAWLLAVVWDPGVGLRAPLLSAVLVVLLGYVLLQMVPLPPRLVEAVSPLAAESQLARFRLFEETGAGELLPSDLKDSSGWLTISASALATRRSLFLLAGCVGVFLVMANVFTEWSHVRKAATVIVVSSFAMALLGTIHKFSGNRVILWFHRARFGGEIFGPFTNPNHYAAYMNMAFAVTLGLLLVASRTPELRVLTTWREKLAWLSTRKAGRIVLLSFAAMLMGASVCISLSKGGISSLAAALGFAGFFVAVRTAVPSRGRVVAAVMLLIVAAVVWLGWEPVVRELGTLVEIDPMTEGRTVMTRATFSIFGSSPIFGCGFGSFQHVFPKFQSPLVQTGRWLHAHNDYAQLVAEGGIGGVLLSVVAAGLFVRVVRKRFAKTSIEGRLFVGGLAVGLVSIALHSFVDYGLHKPADAFLLAALCGMSVAAVHLRSEQKRTNVHRRRRNHGATGISEKQEAPVIAGVS